MTHTLFTILLAAYIFKMMGVGQPDAPHAPYVPHISRRQRRREQYGRKLSESYRRWQDAQSKRPPSSGLSKPIGMQLILFVFYIALIGVAVMAIPVAMSLIHG